MTCSGTSQTHKAVVLNLFAWQAELATPSLFVGQIQPVFPIWRPGGHSGHHVEQASLNASLQGKGA